MKRGFLTAVAATVMAASMSLTAFAGSWQKNAAGWWWQNDDGSYPVSCWQWLDGNGDGTAECYYFNEAGYMLTNTTTPDGYIVNADGAWVVNGTIQTQVVNQNSVSNITQDANNVETATMANGIVIPSAGITLYDRDSSFYVSSIRMDVIDYMKFIDKYKVSYQIEGTLYGDRQVAAYFNCYSADGALLDHSIEIFKSSGKTTDTMHVPANTVRIELVGDDPAPRRSRSSSSGSSTSSRSSSSSSSSSSSGSSSSSSSSDRETELDEEVITPEEFLSRLEYDSGPMEFSSSASTGMVTVSDFTLSNPRRATSKKVKLDYSYTWYATFSEDQLSSIGSFKWYGYDDEGNQYNVGMSTWLSTEHDGVEKTKTGSFSLDSRITRLELTAEFRH